jgi:hypothetical protein
MHTETPGYNKEGHHKFITSMHNTAAKFLPNTIFFQYVNWGFSNEDREVLMKHIVEVCGNGFGGPDIINMQPKRGELRYVLNNAFGSYYRKYKNVAPLSVENQAPGYYGLDARTMFEYAVDEVGVNFLPWSIYNKTDRAWTFNDALKVINEEKGRINSTPPANLIKK